MRLTMLSNLAPEPHNLTYDLEVRLIVCGEVHSVGLVGSVDAYDAQLFAGQNLCLLHKHLSIDPDTARPVPPRGRQ